MITEYKTVIGPSIQKIYMYNNQTKPMNLSKENNIRVNEVKFKISSNITHP